MKSIAPISFEDASKAAMASFNSIKEVSNLYSNLAIELSRDLTAEPTRLFAGKKEPIEFAGSFAVDFLKGQVKLAEKVSAVNQKVAGIVAKQAEPFTPAFAK